MTGDEKESRNKIVNITIPVLIGLALLVRLWFIPFTNYDTDGYSRWYDFIVVNGIQEALGQNFAIYTPPYLYLLSLATLTRNFIPAMVAVKLIPIFFDLMNAILILKIVRLKYATEKVPYIAAIVFLLAPTVVMNSALWGQIDSMYTCFLLASVLLILTGKPLHAMASFGLAFAVKAQAIFLLPFLMLMAVKKRVPWYSFGIIPLAYFVAMLPAIVAGRTITDVFTVYLNQAAELEILSHNAPNWYIFVPQSTYPVSMLIGITVTGFLIAIWIYSHRRFNLEYETILMAALVSVSLTPFLLPKMHDRYFYPADVLSIGVAFAIPQLWFVPLCYQVISTLVYSIFLFDTHRPTMLILATQLNTVILIYLLWKQFKILTNEQGVETAK